MAKGACNELFSDEVLKGLISKVGMPAYAVLAVIAADVTREDPTCRLSIEKIAELVGKSVETTRSAIATLKKHNLIEVELQGRSNVYHVSPLDQ
jgi:DNA-binding transcriptional ArsR family regulator